MRISKYTALRAVQALEMHLEVDVSFGRNDDDQNIWVMVPYEKLAPALDFLRGAGWLVSHLDSSIVGQVILIRHKDVPRDLTAPEVERWLAK